MSRKSSPNQTQERKPFFSRKCDLVDIFALSISTQPTSDNNTRTLDASSFPQSSSNVGGSTRLEVQNLPTGRIRRPDTETGLRAHPTDPNELARSPVRNPVPETGIQTDRTSKKPSSPWNELTALIAFIIIIRTPLAIVFGGVGNMGDQFAEVLFSVYSGGVFVIYISVTVVSLAWTVYKAVKESRNP